jgi:hypothetical protein
MHRVFELYLQTRPRSLREAVRLAGGDDAHRPVSIPGYVSRCARRWQWAARAQKYDDAIAEKDRATFTEARRAARKRRAAQLDRIGKKFSASLESLDLGKMLPSEFTRELVRVHGAERVELGEDSAADRPIGSLPRIEDIIKPESE